MRGYAKSAGKTMSFTAGSAVFKQGEPGDCLYIVQSGELEMVIADRVVEVCGPNEAIGFMSLIDGLPRSSTARVKSDAELSMLDKRMFRFMVDEVPYFSLYIMGAMARRIRGMKEAI